VAAVAVAEWVVPSTAVVDAVVDEPDWTSLCPESAWPRSAPVSLERPVAESDDPPAASAPDDWLSPRASEPFPRSADGADEPLVPAASVPEPRPLWSVPAPVPVARSADPPAAASWRPESVRSESEPVSPERPASAAS
jgi:hypothetical protein